MAMRYVKTITAPILTTNHAGGPAYQVTDDEQVLRLLMTGMMGNTFYVSEKDLATEAVAIFQAMTAKDPMFLAQAIVFARERGYMRSAPIMALVILSTGSELTAKRLFRQIFNRVILTPGDLQDFCTYIRKGKLRGWSRLIRTTGSKWLAPLSEYHIIKYGSQQQQMSLKDIFRLMHPKPAKYATDHLQEKAAYVVKGEVALSLDQVRGYEQFKTSAQRLKAGTHGVTLPDVLSLVDEHRLPWEVVTSQVPADPSVWRHMLYQMPYYALLRNLRNLLKYGALTSATELQYVITTLTDPQRIAKSKLFPFRFYAAREALREIGYSSNANDLSAALAQAMEISYQNLPDLGRVLVANDISGSMRAKATEKSDMTMTDIAAIGAAAIYKHATSGDIVSFTTDAIPRRVNRLDSIMTIASQITQGGGGTSLWAPIAWAFNQDARIYDTAIFFTDSESWAGELQTSQSRGAFGFYPHSTMRATTRSLEVIRQYRRKVNPALNCIFVQLQPYAHTPVPMSEPGCYFVSGWSDQVLSMIGSLHQGNSYLDIIRHTQL